MHPSQAGPFRKSIIVLLTLTFGGALMIYTSMANLALLKSVYPEPQFYMFGLVALEGGVVLWTALYLLHLSGIHKALALFCLGVDALLSGTGFFYEMEQVTNKVGTIQLPPIILIIGFAVVFNVAMVIVSHLLPDGMTFKLPQLQPRNQVESRAALAQTGQINLIADGNQDNQVETDDNQLEKPFTHNGPAQKSWGGKRGGAGRRPIDEP